MKLFKGQIDLNGEYKIEIDGEYLDIKDEKGNVIYREHPFGYCIYNYNGRKTYFKSSNGFWYKKEYNKKGEVIYCKNSLGVVKDNRPRIIVLQAQLIDFVMQTFKCDKEEALAYIKDNFKEE